LSLAKTLNLASGTKVRVVGKPKSVGLGDVDATSSSSAPAAFPKAGQLGTDLNRDVLWKHLLEKYRVQGVRPIALDEVWSAMRFRPAK